MTATRLNGPLAAYPVGSIYMSVNPASPATLFGGTWERITGRFLLGATDGGASNTNGNASQAPGSQAGEATTNLSHSHTVKSHSHTYGIRFQTYWGTLVGNDGDAVKLYNGSSWVGRNGGSPSGSFSSVPRNKALQAAAATGSSSYNDFTTSTGGSSPGTDSKLSTATNNMPPFLAVYIWKRTA